MQKWEKKWEKFLDESRSHEQRILRWTKRHTLEEYWDRIPDSVMERYMSGENKDFILENLQSHDWQKLLRSLRSEFKTAQISLLRGSLETKKDFISLRIRGSKEQTTESILDSIRNGKGRDICNFYGYSISGAQGNVVELEPEWPDRVTEYVYGDCCGVLWHLCPKVMVDSVLRNGLRCKNRDNDRQTRNSRNYPKRIYFYATPVFRKSTIKLALEELASELSGKEQNALEDFQALKIQLPKSFYAGWIPLYFDTCSDSGACCFTYTNIPADLIKPVNF